MFLECPLADIISISSGTTIENCYIIQPLKGGVNFLQTSIKFLRNNQHLNFYEGLL